MAAPISPRGYLSTSSKIDLPKYSSANKENSINPNTPSTQGKRMDDIKDMHLGGTSHNQPAGDQAKYPIKIPVELMKPKKTQQKKSDHVGGSRPATAKPSKSTHHETAEKTQQKNEGKTKKEPGLPLKRKTSLSKDFTSETKNEAKDRRNAETRKSMDGILSEEQEKKKVNPSSKRPQSSRVENRSKNNKQRDSQTLSLTRQPIEKKYPGVSKEYLEELKEAEENKKELKKKAKELMTENLTKYHEELKAKEQEAKMKEQEKAMKREKALERNKENVSKRHTYHSKSPVKYDKDEWKPEPKKMEPKKAEVKGHKEEEIVEKRDPVKRMEEMQAAYLNSLEGKNKKGKKKEEEKDPNGPGGKYDIKKKERAPEEKEKLKKLVHEQFEKRKREEMEQRHQKMQEQERRKQKVDALLKGIGKGKEPKEMKEQKEHGEKNYESINDHKKAEKARQPFGNVDLNVVRHVHEALVKSDNKKKGKEEKRKKEEEYELGGYGVEGGKLELDDDVIDEMERDYLGKIGKKAGELKTLKEKGYSPEGKGEKKLEKGAYERFKSAWGEKMEKGKEQEQERDYREEESNQYTLEPLGKITHSEEDMLMGKYEGNKGYGKYSKGSSKKESLREEESRRKESGEEENVREKGRKRSQEMGREERVEKEKEDKGDEGEEHGEKQGDQIDFDDMLFNMSSQDLFKLPYFSIVK